MAYEQLMSSAGGVPLILADLRARATAGTVTPTPTPTPGELVPNPVAAMTTVGSVGTGGGIYDTGSIHHTIECDAMSTISRLAFRYEKEDSADYFDNNKIGNTQVNGTQRISGRGEFGNFPNQTDLGFAIAAGDVNCAEEGPLGARIYIKRGGNEIWTSEFQNGNTVPFTNKVALLPGDPVTGLRYGPLLNPLYFDYVEFDSFARKVKVRVFYSHAAGSTAPASPEVQFGGSGPWYPMTIVASIKGQADLEFAVPAGITGWKPDSKIRWGNLPSLVQRKFDVDIGLPFGGMVGGNVDAQRLSDGPFDDQFLLLAVDGAKPGKQIGNETYNVSPDEPNFVRGVPLGATGGVQIRQVTQNTGDFGRNDLGITKYAFDALANISSFHAGTYTCKFPAGVEVVSQSETTPGLGWSYNQSTGIGTFTAPAGQLIRLRLHITVATIPAGTLVSWLDATPRLNSIPAGKRVNPTLVATYEKPLSDGSRPLDGLISYNNRSIGTHTHLTVGENTPDTEPAYNTDIEIALANELDAKMQWAFNTQLDTAATVRQKARRFALETPAGRKIFATSSPNESPWNYFFTQGHDWNIIGMRAGLYSISDATQTRTPRTIWDALSTKIAMETDASGGPFNDNTRGFIKFNIPFPANTAFYIGLNGGYITMQTKVDVAAGEIHNYYNAYNGTSAVLRVFETTSFEQSNGWAAISGKRAYAERTIRDEAIWREEFTAAGRAADLEYVLDLQTQVGTGDEIFPWANVRSKVKRAAYGPYFNGGLFGLNWMNYEDPLIWTPEAKAFITAGNYVGAVEYVIPRVIPLYRAHITKNLLAIKKDLFKKNVAAGLAVDVVRPIYYEFGDHSVFQRPNGWSDEAKAYAFNNAFLQHALYETFSIAYFEMIGNACDPGFLYSTKAGERSAFCLTPTYDNRSMTGPTTTDWTYRAWRKTVERVRAVVAAAG